MKLEAEKYKWHDLRKNPNDLPAEDCRVLTANILKSGYCYYKVANFAIDLDFDEYWGMSGFYDYDSDCGYYPVNVDVWKYIEGLEEQSEIVHCKNCKYWAINTFKGIHTCMLAGWLCGEDGFCMHGVSEVE